MGFSQSKLVTKSQWSTHHDSETWSIRGKRYVAISETDARMDLDEAMVKNLTGSSTMAMRGLYKGKESQVQPLRASIDIDSDEFLAGEATPEGRYVCERCLTGTEEAAIADDMAATEGALESAGLADPVAVEAMDEDEVEMREELFAILYDHESTEGRWAEPRQQGPQEEG